MGITSGFLEITNSNVFLFWKAFCEFVEAEIGVCLMILALCLFCFLILCCFCKITNVHGAGYDTDSSPTDSPLEIICVKALNVLWRSFLKLTGCQWEAYSFIQNLFHSKSTWPCKHGTPPYLHVLCCKVWWRTWKQFNSCFSHARMHIHDMDDRHVI